MPWKCAKGLITFLTVFLIFVRVSQARQFKVVQVFDGDTVKAVGHDIEIKVRLVCIDAPQRSKKKRDPEQPYSEKATKYLAGMVLNKTIDLKIYGLDQYNRILGVIYVCGKNVNLEMVKAGYAEVSRGRSPRGFDIPLYQAAEAAARKAGYGMWSLGDEYISPREWREKHRSR